MAEDQGTQSVGEHTLEALRETVLRLVIRAALGFFSLLLVVEVIRGIALFEFLLTSSAIAVFGWAAAVRLSRPSLAATIVVSCVASLSWLSFWINPIEKQLSGVLGLAVSLLIASFCSGRLATALLGTISSLLFAAVINVSPQWASISGWCDLV